MFPESTSNSCRICLKYVTYRLCNVKMDNMYIYCTHLYFNCRNIDVIYAIPKRASNRREHFCCTFYVLVLGHSIEKIRTLVYCVFQTYHNVLCSETRQTFAYLTSSKNQPPNKPQNPRTKAPCALQIPPWNPQSKITQQTHAQPYVATNQSQKQRSVTGWSQRRIRHEA